MNLFCKYVLRTASIDGHRPLWQPAEDVVIVWFIVIIVCKNFCLPQINFFLFVKIMALRNSGIRKRLIFFVRDATIGKNRFAGSETMKQSHALSACLATKSPGAKLHCMAGDIARLTHTGLLKSHRLGYIKKIVKMKF
jgi:hypothetical protein